MMTLQTEASFTSSGLTALSKFVRLTLQSLALGLGALLAISGKISPGAIFASMFMVGRALAPIDLMVGSWKSILQARGAYNTLSETLNQTPTDISMTQLPRPEGRLQLENVGVLDPQRRPIIANITFQVDPGEVVAIVGPSGAGKSTLVRAISGAQIPDAGSVRFDGAEQRDWDPERLAEYIGFMPQEPALFAGTIKENISRFRSDLGEDSSSIDRTVVEAAQAAGAHDLILRLPSGYGYQLGLGGKGLSAGQAQRVALARALFRQPRYLILDEPNSNLDAEGDAQLIKTLEDAKAKGVSVLLVAHRLSVLPIVDKILVIKNGRLQTYGPRDEVFGRISPGEQPRIVVTNAQAKQ
jgi:ATP-binding cassette subfamily C protein